MSTEIRQPGNDDSPDIDLSVVVPLYNEEESVELMYASIVDALEPQNMTFEAVFVDDGSRDQTVKLAGDMAARDPRLRVVVFRRNYGQTAAMAAGIEKARGDIIVTMDGDLQNDPKDIPNFVEKLNEGYDIVVGWRFNRKDKLISRKIPSRIANWLIGKVTGVPIRDNGCSLKAYRSKIIKRVPLYNEMHRFIPAMASITGAKIAEIKVRHHARQFGASKYGLSRIYRVLLDLLTVKTIVGFARRPLVWYGLISIPFFILGAIATISGLLPLLTAEEAMSMPLTGTGILFVTLGFLLLMGGAVGELIHITDNSTVTRTSTPIAISRISSGGAVSSADVVVQDRERNDE